MTYDPDARDPGLAAERTDLAWNRSGLSLLACGAVVLRGLGRPPLEAPNVAVGTCLLLLGASMWFLEAWNARARRSRAGRPATASDLAPLAWGAVAVGVAAFVLCVVSP